MAHTAFGYADPIIPAAKAKPGKGPIGRFFARVMQAHAGRKQQELATMSDRALQDIGVTRHELRFLAHKPTVADAFRFLSHLRIPDPRYETRPYK